MIFLTIFETYQKSFSSSIKGSWDDNTIILYIFIIFLTSWLSHKAQGYNSNDNRNRTKRYFILIGVILSLFLGLRGVTVGADTLQYRNIWENCNIRGYDFGTIEYGFRYINQVLASIVNDGRFGVLFFSSITIYLFLKGIYEYGKDINYFLAVSSFSFIFYLQSLNLLRIYLAAGFLIFAFKYIYKDENYVKYLFCILVASFIHSSSLVLLFPLMMLWIYRKNKSIACILYIAAFGIIYSLKDLLFAYVTIARYSAYADSNEVNEIGLLGILEFLPVFYAIYYIVRHKLSGWKYDVIVAFSSVAFLFRILSYFISAVGRLSIQFIQVYVLLFPLLVGSIGVTNSKTNKKIIILYTLYLIFRLHTYFLTMLGPDEIMPYTTIFSE